MSALSSHVSLPTDLSERRALAWIGDAVLGLYVRSWILRHQGQMNGTLFSRATSNEFLLRLGDPTTVEAVIGALYQREGLAAAWLWLDGNLLDHLEREACGGPTAKRRG